MLENIECVDVLVKAGADINFIDTSGPFSALHHGIGCLEMTRYLISAGANVNAAPEDDPGQTPLLEAAHTGSLECGAALIAAGANILGDGEKGVPLREAVEINNPDFVEMLIENGADINAGDECVMWRAAYEGHARCLALLIKAGGNVHTGRSLISVAAENYIAEYGHHECIHILLAAGLHADIEDDNGITPLMFLNPKTGEKIYSPNWWHDRIIATMKLLVWFGGDVSRITPTENTAEVFSREFQQQQREHKLSLQGICQMAVRRQLMNFNPGTNLFKIVPQLPITEPMKRLLLDDVCLEAKYLVDEFPE
jgi:hypothetical protein